MDIPSVPAETMIDILTRELAAAVRKAAFWEAAWQALVQKEKP